MTSAEGGAALTCKAKRVVHGERMLLSDLLEFLVTTLGACLGS